MKLNNSALLIVAAGKSSRFGGYPKALCNIGSKTNVENTISLAKPYFENIYLGLNVETKTDIEIDAKVLRIETGQGDSLSLLKLIRLVKKDNQNIDKLFVCWGDAYFASSKPFEQFSMNINNKDNLYVACSLDKNPYAWFDVDENGYINKSHFKAKDGDISIGVHDQSLFCFDINVIEKYINEYKNYIGLVSEDYNPNESKEAKLLDIFTYLSEKEAVKTILIDKDNVLSFNTKEELDKIISGHLK